jgi:hypothetical protein
MSGKAIGYAGYFIELGAFVDAQPRPCTSCCQRAVRARSVWLDSAYLVDVAVPFRRFKQSGWGRELPESRVRAFTEIRTVTINLQV